MRLELDNIVVETEDALKIARYKELGYREVGKGRTLEDLSKEELIAFAKEKGLTFEDEEVVGEGETRSYHDLGKNEIMAELDKAGKEYNKRATKDELIAILESDE